MKGILFVLVIVAATILADYFLKVASQKTSMFAGYHLYVGMGIYLLTGFAWVLAMRTMTLGAIGVIYSGLMLFLLVLMSTLIFKETMLPASISGWRWRCAPFF